MSPASAVVIRPYLIDDRMPGSRNDQGTKRPLENPVKRCADSFHRRAKPDPQGASPLYGHCQHTASKNETPKKVNIYFAQCLMDSH